MTFSLTLTVKETNLLIMGFSTLFFSGFLLANSILISASFIPLFLYAIGVFFRFPEVQVKRIGLPGSARLGETVEAKIAGKITGGPGAVVICDKIPEQFKLVEGSNYKVVSKGFREKEFAFSYKVECTKCGNYHIGIGWETRHILGLTQTSLSIEEARQLKVFPTLRKIRRINVPVRTAQRTYPIKGATKMGPLSTDFKEIRSYFYGDPFKIINWKATARATSWGRTYPLVNEYEREGKPAIWIFLDSSPELNIGTSLENALEYSVRIAYNISYYFLSKGYNLGLYVYNHRGETVLLDTGKKQFIKIAENLLRPAALKVGVEVFWDEGFSAALEKNLKYLRTQAAAIIIVTHVASNNFDDLVNGLRRLLAYKKRRQHINVLLINVLPYGVIPKVNDLEIFAAKMRELASRSYSSRLRNLGLTVLDWEPKEESVELILPRTVRLR